MDTKDTRGPQLARTPEMVVTRDPVGPTLDRPVLLSHRVPVAPAARSRLRRAVQLVVVLGLALAVAVAGWLALRGGGGDDAVLATDRGAPVAKQAGTAPLSLHVEVPSVVTAGNPAQIVVRYEDGDGVFSGSTEDWGDGVGTSSLAQGRCTAAGTTPAPVDGSYQAVHTWKEPGRYTVSVGVSSYACVDGAPVEEQATTTVKVEVAAR